MPSTPVKEITDQIHEVPSSGSVSEDETTASTINGSGCNKHNNFDVQSTVSSSNSVIQHALIPAANAGSSTIQLQDAFEMILSKLKSKEFKPLMTDEHVQKARSLQNYAKQKKLPMTTARNTYVPDQTSYPFYLQQYTRKLFWFFTARYNGHDDLQFSQVIPFPEGSIEFGKQKKHLQARREESSREALGFILQATNAIIGTVEEMGAKGLFANLSQTQRKDIFGAVFDQYPLWLVKMKFRKQEAVAVDFCQIFAGKDSDREKFQLFFRHMFVDMCESTYITHVREARSDAEEAMKLIWAGFAFSSYVEALGLGDQYEFPGISTGINSRGPSSAKVASDDFDSDIEAPKPVPKRAPNGEGNLKNARIWW